MTFALLIMFDFQASPRCWPFKSMLPSIQETVVVRTYEFVYLSFFTSWILMNLNDFCPIQVLLCKANRWSALLFRICRVLKTLALWFVSFSELHSLFLLRHVAKRRFTIFSWINRTFPQIPVPVIEHFLQDVARNHAVAKHPYLGFCTLGIHCQAMENPHLRAFKKMKQGQVHFWISSEAYLALHFRSTLSWVLESFIRKSFCLTDWYSDQSSPKGVAFLFAASAWRRRPCHWR